MAAAGDDVVEILGVQVLKVLHGHSHYGADLVEVQVAAYFEGVDLGGHADILGHDSVFAPVGHGVHRAHECGHVAARLSGQEGIDAPEVSGAAGPPDGLGDVARAAVVGADGKGPVAEDLVGVAQIAGCRVDRLLHVKAFVHVGVDLQPVAAGRAVHELPHSAGSRPGAGDGVQHGFDDGHVLELQRQSVAVEDLLEYREVMLAQTHDPAHLGAHLLGIEYDVVLDHVVVWQRYEGVHVGQSLLDFGVGDVGGEVYAVHVVFVHYLEVSLEGVLVPEVEEAVGHLGRVFDYHRVGLGGIPLYQREQLRLHLAVALFEAVDQNLERVEALAEPVVFTVELLSGRAAEPVGENVLGVELAAQQKRNQQYCRSCHRQKLNPSLRPIAGVVPGLLNASWLSGIITVGDTFIARSSLTSKPCM